MLTAPGGRAYRNEHVLWLVEQQCCRCQVVVLQRGNVILCQRQGMKGLDEEVIVDAAMFIVMYHS